MTPESLSKLCNGYQLTLHHSVSLTGGEPLLHKDFIKELIPLISGTERGIFLETNGTMPESLRHLIDELSIISMDIKLRSSTKIDTPWELHGEFLKIAAKQDVYVKLVISDNTEEEEVSRAAVMVKRAAPNSALILQPVTSTNGVLAPSVQQVLKLQEIALRELINVRVIPQTIG
nr:hypothetical protein [Desulforamulus aquiferis]